MDYKELQSKSARELSKMLAEERAHLFGFRMKTSVSRVREVRALRAVRKTIAQLHTRLGARLREEAK